MHSWKLTSDIDGGAIDDEDVTDVGAIAVTVALGGQ